MLSRNVAWKVEAVFAAGPLATDPLAGLVSGPPLSVPWLCEVDPPESVSAAAIPPPALPMSRPVDSRQIPVAKRKCVEIRISSGQQGSRRELSRMIVAYEVHQLPRI